MSRDAQSTTQLANRAADGPRITADDNRDLRGFFPASTGTAALVRHSKNENSFTLVVPFTSCRRQLDLALSHQCARSAIPKFQKRRQECGLDISSGHLTSNNSEGDARARLQTRKQSTDAVIIKNTSRQHSSKYAPFRIYFGHSNYGQCSISGLVRSLQDGYSVNAQYSLFGVDRDSWMFRCKLLQRLGKAPAETGHNGSPFRQIFLLRQAFTSSLPGNPAGRYRCQRMVFYEQDKSMVRLLVYILIESRCSSWAFNARCLQLLCETRRGCQARLQRIR